MDFAEVLARRRMVRNYVTSLSIQQPSPGWRRRPSGLPRQGSARARR